MDIDELEKLNKIKNNSFIEGRDSVIKTIKISDSYLYAKMNISKASIMEDPFSKKVVVNLEINLVNSNEFSTSNMVNSHRMVQAKVIKSKLILDSYDLIKSDADAMMLVYDEVAKEIAKDLFQANAGNINMVIKDTREFM